jgi:hypothetical protein
MCPPDSGKLIAAIFCKPSTKTPLRFVIATAVRHPEPKALSVSVFGDGRKK